MPDENTTASNTPNAQGGSKPTHQYKIQIDKEFFTTNDPMQTGRTLLQLAGKTPPEQYALYQKLKGSQPIRVALDQPVDLREPGTERFVTLPLDQTEG